MSKLEKNFSADVRSPILSNMDNIGQQDVDIAALVEENQSLRDLAIGIMLACDLLREEIKEPIRYH